MTCSLRLWRSAIWTTVLLLRPLLPGARVLAAQHAPDIAAVRVDSAKHLVVITAGPWDIPSAAPGPRSEHSGHVEPPPQRFVWPVNGWIRAATLRLLTSTGVQVPHGMMHHLEVVNLGRRELFYPAAERIIGFGKETEDLRLPSSIGVPMTAGMPMAIAGAWTNTTGADLHDFRVELTVEWLPQNTVPRPLSVLPVTMVVIHSMFDESGFDLPSGTSTWSRDFSLPVNGRILAAGGHLHDYATGLALQDVSVGTTPRQVLALGTKHDADGHLVGVGRLLPGIMGGGIRIKQGHTYRVVSTYDNQTGAMIPGGAMTHLVVLFAPDHLDAWPAVAPNDSLWKTDQDYLFHRVMAGMKM
jgi:hypothetical protein